MERRPPKFVLDAIKRGDTEILRHAGRKGAEKTNLRRDFEKAVKDLEAELNTEEKILEEGARKRSTNEDIISSDGEDLTGEFFFLDED